MPLTQIGILNTKAFYRLYRTGNRFARPRRILNGDHWIFSQKKSPNLLYQITTGWVRYPAILESCESGIHKHHKGDVIIQENCGVLGGKTK